MPLVFAARQLVRPLLLLMAIADLFFLLAGESGYFAARAGWVGLVGPLASRIPAERHTLYQADLWAHLAACLVGFLGAVVLRVKTWRRRSSLLSN